MWPNDNFNFLLGWIKFYAMLCYLNVIRLKSMCVPPVNTVQDGQTEILWGKRRSVQLSVGPTIVKTTKKQCLLPKHLVTNLGTTNLSLQKKNQTLFTNSPQVFFFFFKIQRPNSIKYSPTYLKLPHVIQVHSLLCCSNDKVLPF